jgi:pimeloyl-ACP methyl ester carboxylesterase
MTDPFRRRQLLCASPTGLHRVSYVEWGDPENDRVLVCVHGLSRCARDFDGLAAALASRYRVASIDLPGRGESEWLAQPMEYVIPTYVNDVITLVARLGVEQIDYVGTSLGGMIGMAIAAHPASPIRRMVANESSPVVPGAALERIGEYFGKAPDFASIEDAERYVRMVSAPFGPHSDAQWRFLTEHVVIAKPEGGYRLRYDPAIAVAYNAQRPFKDLELWPLWDAIRCPTLVLRGEHSDVLPRQVAAAMTQRGPRAELVELAGIGHGPTLLHADQIEIVASFLARGG